MFRVKEKERAIIWTVYSVSRKEGQTLFLFHDGVGWFWDDMISYVPID